MAANYLHGIETLEVEHGPRAIRVVKSAVIALIGTAPVGPVNTLTLSLNDRDGAQFGPELPGFSIPQALAGIYDFGAGTVIVVNVLDPLIHRTSVVAQARQFGNNDRLKLGHGALQVLTLMDKRGDGTLSTTEVRAGVGRGGPVPCTHAGTRMLRAAWS
jgi:phage tail sheath protein FI